MGEDGGGVGREGAQKLRYKSFQVLRIQAVDPQKEGRLQEGAGIREFTELKEMSAYLRECGVFEWWRRNMVKSADTRWR